MQDRQTSKERQRYSAFGSWNTELDVIEESKETPATLHSIIGTEQLIVSQTEKLWSQPNLFDDRNYINLSSLNHPINLSHKIIAYLLIYKYFGVEILFDRIEQTWQRKMQLYFVSPLFEQPDPPFTSNVPARHSPPSLPPGTDSVTCFWRFSASPYDWNLLCCLTDMWTSWGLQAL